MIVIKDGRGIIIINPAAELAEIMTLEKFRKLLKMASNKNQNNCEKLRTEFINQLERERIEREKDLERTDVFYSRREKNHTLSVLKKIEKMKSEVMKNV